MGSKAIGLLTMVFGADMKGFNKAMTKAEKSLKKFSRNMKRAGKQMTTNLTMPILAVGGAAAKLSMDFDTSMTKITTLVGIADDEVQKMKKSVLDLSMETGQGPQQLAEGLFFLTSAGLRGANALETLEQVSKASAAGLGNMEDLSRAVAAAQNAYGIETLTASDALDIFGGMVQTGMFKAEELAGVLGENLGLAANLGISFEEVGAFISTYTKVTGSATSATTGLGAVMMSFAKITPKQEKALAKVGLTTDELRQKLSTQGLQKTLIELEQRFGQAGVDMSEFFSKSNALKGVMGVLGEQTQTYDEVLQDLLTTQGFVDQAFDRTAETAGFKMKKAFNSLKVAGTELGDTLAPVIDLLARKILQLSEWFRGLSSRQRESIVRFAGIIAVIGPTLILFGQMATGILGVIKVLKILNAVALANPYILLAAGLTAVVVALSNYNKEGIRKLTLDEKLANVDKKADELVKDRVTRVNELTNKLKNENLTLIQKEKIVAELKRISPKYYGGLSAASLDVNQLTKSTEQYVTALKAEAKIKAATALISEREMKIVEIDEYIKEFEGSSNHITKSLVKDAKQMRERLADEIKTYQKVVDGEFKNMQQSSEEFNESLDFDSNYQNFLSDLDDLEDKTTATMSEMEKLNARLRDAQDNLRDLIINKAGPEAIEKAVKKVNEVQEEVNAATDEYNRLLGKTEEKTKDGPFSKLEDSLQKAENALKTAIAEGKDYTTELENYKKAQSELNEKVDEYNNLTKESKKNTESFAGLLDKLIPNFKVFGKSLGDIFHEFGDLMQEGLNVALGALNAYNDRAMVIAQNEQKRKTKELDDRLRDETAMINNSSMTEEQRMRALAILDDEIAAERVKIEEESAEKINKIKRRQAVIDKAIAIQGIILDTARAAMKAYAMLGPIAGPIAAAIVGAIGAAQIALVASTPIPLAEGGIISGPTTALMGEYPSAMTGNPEVVAPLNKLKQMIGPRQDSIQIFGRLTGQDIFLSNQHTSQNRLRTT